MIKNKLLFALNDKDKHFMGFVTAVSPDDARHKADQLKLRVHNTKYPIAYAENSTRMPVRFD